MNLASGVLQPHEMMSARRMPGRPLALENGPAPSFRFRRLMYGRKPRLEDADGDFKIRVSLEMQMSIAGARYYLHLASNVREKDADQPSAQKLP